MSLEISGFKFCLYCSAFSQVLLLTVEHLSAAFSDFSRFNPSEQAYLHRLFLWAGNRNAANSNGLFDTTGRPQESLIVELDQSLR